MKRFALIGHDIGYSLSPLVHGEIYRAMGYEAEYELISLTKEELPAAVPYLRSLDGFNITKPHKQNIIPFVKTTLKSVNTVKVEKGRMYGFSTDGYGFTRDLEISFGKVSGTALVLGAGGAARVVAGELVGLGLDTHIWNRTPEKARALGAETGAVFAPSRRDVKADLVVNCTSFGFNPGENPALDERGLAIDPSCVKWAYDTIYSPPETEFLKSFPLAERRNGWGMLILQAVQADRIMCGLDISDEREREIYDRLLARLAAEK